LEIQWADAQRFLTMLIDNLEKKRRFESDDFDEKVRRLTQWSNHFLDRELNQRLDGLTLQTSLDLLNNDIRTLLMDKQRTAEDLLVQARLFSPTCIDAIKKIISSLNEHLATKFVRFFPFRLPHPQLRSSFSIRIQQVQSMLNMFHEYEQSVDQLRSWMNNVQVTLQQSISSSRFDNNTELGIHQQSIEVSDRDLLPPFTTREPHLP
jgi:hypothetical protein